MKKEYKLREFVMNELTSRISFMLAFAIFVLACASTDNYEPLKTSHVEAEGEDLRFCLDCHDGDDKDFNYKIFIHTISFVENHRLVASHSADICYMCHKSSHCGECHATRVELKPSIKNQTDVHKRMPHRGDYLSRHMIDGRMDPVSCYRCHGNPKTSKTCRPCHG